VSKMLDKIGMEPEWTMSGKEAVLRVRSALEMDRHFSVYFVDWKMPDMNGLEVVRQLRQLVGDEVPIFVLTAYDFSNIQEQAAEAGATGFCQKPLFFSQLRTALLNFFEKTAETPAINALLPTDGLEGKRVLLVEDNELNQEIAQELLTEAGFIVDTADNGKAAVDRLMEAEENSYDIVLMDIQMPVMDGYEATRAIRAVAAPWVRELPILAMTANAFEEDRKKALEAGMNGHLVKPVDIDELFASLAEILR